MRKTPEQIKAGLEQYLDGAEPRLAQLVIDTVIAIRQDKTIGYDTMSSVDEAMTDKEIAEQVIETVPTMRGRWKYCVKAYVNQFKHVEKVRQEYAEDIRNA